MDGRRRELPSLNNHVTKTARGRIRGSGLLTRVIVWTCFPPWIAAWVFSFLRYDLPLYAQLVYGAIITVSAALLMRSLWIGLCVKSDGFVVRGWYRTRFVASADIDRVILKPYIGVLTGWSIAPGLLNSRFMMLGVRTKDGRVALFPSTVAGRRLARSHAHFVASSANSEVIVLPLIS